MPNAISPEAARFPEQSEKIDVLLDTVSIKHAADIFIARFKNNFVHRLSNEGHQFIGGGMFSPNRGIRDFVEMAERSGNSYVIAQIIRVVYEMDTHTVLEDQAEQWILERIEIDGHLAKMFETPGWKNYVDECDSKDSLRGPQQFCEYQQQGIWRRESILREMLVHKHQKLFNREKDDDEEDEIEKKTPRVSAHELMELVEISIKLEDQAEIERLIELHFDSEKISSYSTPQGDYLFRKNIQLLFEKLHQLAPTRVLEFLARAMEVRKRKNETIQDLSESIQHNHIAIVAAYVLSDWQTLFEVVTDDTGKEAYSAYQLKLLAELIQSEKIHLALDSKNLLIDFIVSRIKELSPRAKLDVLSSFQHPALIPDCIESIINELNGNHADKSKLGVLVTYIEKNAPIVEKKRIIEYVHGRLKAELSRLEAGDTERTRESFLGSKTSVAVEIGLQLGDTQILEELIEVSLPLFGASNTDTWAATEVVQKAAPYLIEHGNAFAVENLQQLVTSWFAQLNDIILAKYVDTGKTPLGELMDALPSMIVIFEAMQKYHPEKDIQIGEGEDTRLFSFAQVIEKTVQFYEWISQGIEIFNAGKGYYHRSSWSSRRLAEALLQHTSSTKLKQRVKTALLAESLRQYDLGEYTEAAFQVQIFFDGVEEKWLKEKDILGFLGSSNSNLRWIADKLMPEASPVWRSAN